MTLVKDAPRTATTLVVRSSSGSRITRSRDPYYALMRRLFQEEATALRARKFLLMVEERQNSGNPIKISEWEELIREFGISRSSFYAMRNKLLGAGLISSKNREYRLSELFSLDLMDMARWWWTAVLNNDPEKL
jgi:DNA-binding transcriptional regulator PaaX